jgi:formate dehydrogenase major subunit
MGCLPYYETGYKSPSKTGYTTPKIIDKILEGEIKAVFNMGEDIYHIHPNLNKIEAALEKLDFLVVNELFLSKIAKKADLVFGVKSGYEKEGVYINAERKMQLSTPLIKSSLPDDWEVIQNIAKRVGNYFWYRSSEEIWDEVRQKDSYRFKYATYKTISKERPRWPYGEKKLKRLFLSYFHTSSKKAKLNFFSYKIRGMVKDIMEDKKFFYLTTGRIISHYNNSSQTKECSLLEDKHKEDILLISLEDETAFKKFKRIVLKTPYGKSSPLRFKFTKSLKKGCMFVSFHHSKSNINYLFGEERDEIVDCAKLKSLKVEIEGIE